MIDGIILVEKEINNKKIKIVWNKKYLRAVVTYIDGDARPFIFTTTRYELGPNTAFDIAMSQLKATEELLLI
jgi:hypothetical protein|tara:strand:- start:53 stop:268 length:216 start_codon:yes stop_codon:yes gene_type:complete